MPIKQLSKLSAAMLLITAFTACAHDSEKTIDDSTLLTAYHWHMDQALDSEGKSDTRLLSADRKTPATFNFHDDRVGVSGLCNGLGAAYSLDGSVIKVEPVVSTMKMCDDEELMRYERQVAQRLTDATSWQIEQTETAPRLTLSFKDGAEWILSGTETDSTKYGSAGETLFLEIAPETVPCVHPLMGDHECLKVRTVNYDSQGLKQGHGDWQNFYERIENYEHSAGVRDVLRVKRYESTNPAADASSYDYVLDMVVETEQQ